MIYRTTKNRALWLLRDYFNRTIPIVRFPCEVIFGSRGFPCSLTSGKIHVERCSIAWRHAMRAARCSAVQRVAASRRAATETRLVRDRREAGVVGRRDRREQRETKFTERRIPRACIPLTHCQSRYVALKQKGRKRDERKRNTFDINTCQFSYHYIHTYYKYSKVN